VLSERGTWRELEVVGQWNWAENEFERSGEDCDCRCKGLSSVDQALGRPRRRSRAIPAKQIDVYRSRLFPRRRRFNVSRYSVNGTAFRRRTPRNPLLPPQAAERY
jgi:hypothetical protein